LSGAPQQPGATYAHHIPKDVEGWRAGTEHDVYHILRGFMESVALASKNGLAVARKEDGMYMGGDYFGAAKYGTSLPASDIKIARVKISD